MAQVQFSGFDRGYVSRVERGVQNPAVLVLARMANALGVDVIELFDPVKTQQLSKSSRAQPS